MRLLLAALLILSSTIAFASTTPLPRPSAETVVTFTGTATYPSGVEKGYELRVVKRSQTLIAEGTWTDPHGTVTETGYLLGISPDAIRQAIETTYTWSAYPTGERIEEPVRFRLEGGNLQAQLPGTPWLSELTEGEGMVTVTPGD